MKAKMMRTTTTPGKLLVVEENDVDRSGALGRGRSPATFEPVKINFCSSVGACGTMIFWKHVGHSIWVPDCDESHLMCWPHTGQAYLNSLMIAQNISHFHPPGNGLFRGFLIPRLY